MLYIIILLEISLLSDCKTNIYAVFRNMFSVIVYGLCDLDFVSASFSQLARCDFLQLLCLFPIVCVSPVCCLMCVCASVVLPLWWMCSLVLVMTPSQTNFDFDFDLCCYGY